MRKSFCIISLTLLLIGGIQIYAQTLSQEQISAIEKVIIEEMKTASVPGVALGIINNNMVVYEKGFGQANNQTRMPMTDSTIFQIASVTKTFTALTVLNELRKANFGVHEPVGKVIQGLSPVVSSVTFHQLLTHTGGLKDYTNLKDKTNVFDFYEEIGDSILFIEPGKLFSYSNTGYALLDLVIEQLSGMNYHEAVVENVIKPLKLHNTSFDIYESAAKSLSAGHVWTDKGLVPEIYHCEKPLVRAAGGLFSNIQDLERLTTCLMNDGIFEGVQVFNPDIIEQMRQPYAEDFQASASTYFGASNAPNSAYGQGIWMFDYGNYRINVTAGGGTQMTMVFYEPEAKFAYIFTSNKAWEFMLNSMNKIFEIVLGEKLSGIIDFKSDQAEWKDISGRYYLPAYRSKQAGFAEISEIDDKIYVNFNEAGALELEQIGTLTYRFSAPYSRFPTAIIFHRDESAEVTSLKHVWRTWLKAE